MAANDVCPMSDYAPVYEEKHLALPESFINWQNDLLVIGWMYKAYLTQFSLPIEKGDASQ